MKSAEPATRSSISGGTNSPGTAFTSVKEAEEQLDAMNAEGARIQRLLEQLESLPSPTTRELVHEFMEATLGFYGQGLARILQIVRDAGSEGDIIHRRLINDKVIRGLLLIHDLHPADLETRLRGALEEVRPYLKSHGGNLELISLENQAASLRFQGTCGSCASSAVTLELAIRHAIEEACPDLAGFTVEGVAERPETLETNAHRREQKRPNWIALENAEQLDEGAWMPLRVAGKRLVICRVNGNLYAYRNNCPACNTPFDAGALEMGWLRCPMGHHYDIVHAGRCTDVPTAHLEPYPLLIQDDIVKVALSV